MFAEQGSSISGDMFFNGSVQENSIAIDGTTYNGSGSVGELLVIPPTFPELNETKYNNLLSDAELYQDSYTNYALKFDGNDDFIK